MIEGTAPAIVLERCDSPNLPPICLHTLLCIVVRAGGERFGESHLCKTMGACCSFYHWYIFLGHDIFYLQFWVPHKPVNIFSNTEIILARYSNINIEHLHFVACSRCQSLISSYTVVVHHLISYSSTLLKGPAVGVLHLQWYSTLVFYIAQLHSFWLLGTIFADFFFFCLHLSWLIDSVNLRKADENGEEKILVLRRIESSISVQSDPV